MLNGLKQLGGWTSLSVSVCPTFNCLIERLLVFEVWTFLSGLDNILVGSFSSDEQRRKNCRALVNCERTSPSLSITLKYNQLLFEPIRQLATPLHNINNQPRIAQEYNSGGLVSPQTTCLLYSLHTLLFLKHTPSQECLSSWKVNRRHILQISSVIFGWIDSVESTDSSGSVTRNSVFLIKKWLNQSRRRCRAFSSKFSCDNNNRNGDDSKHHMHRYQGCSEEITRTD